MRSRPSACVWAATDSASERLVVLQSGRGCTCPVQFIAVDSPSLREIYQVITQGEYGSNDGNRQQTEIGAGGHSVTRGMKRNHYRAKTLECAPLPVDRAPKVALKTLNQGATTKSSTNSSPSDLVTGIRSCRYHIERTSGFMTLR